LLQWCQQGCWQRKIWKYVTSELYSASLSLS
jgi:hypothetical protein